MIWLQNNRRGSLGRGVLKLERNLVWESSRSLEYLECNRVSINKHYFDPFSIHLKQGFLEFLRLFWIVLIKVD